MSDITLTIALSEEEWVTAVCALETLVYLIKDGDFGEEEENAAYRVSWTKSLKVSDRVIKEALKEWEEKEAQLHEN